MKTQKKKTFNLKKINIVKLSNSHAIEIKGGTRTVPRTHPRNPCGPDLNTSADDC